MIARVALLAVVVACGDPPAHVQLVPVNPCGQVMNETSLRIVAYTAAGETRRTVPPLDIEAFPADTEQLGAEVIGMGGALVAIGKTAPLEFGGLEDGTTIPIVMGRPDGLCPTLGTMTEPRVAPVVARAGQGVLIVGGVDAGGKPLSTAEYYDPATTTFMPVEVPANLVDIDNGDNGLAGAVLTELPDGSVALSGTASHALAVFSPMTLRFAVPQLFDHRAFHGAIAPDTEHLFIIGGCAEVVARTCAGPALRTGFNYSISDVTMRDRGPQLPDTAKRFGAQVLDVGIQRDGAHRYVLVGGAGDPGVADRFALGDVMTEPISGMHAQAVLLDGGAVLTTFDPDGTAQSGLAAVLAPDAAVVPISLAPKLDGTRLATLEDGSVVALGPALYRYVPTTDAWLSIGIPPAPLFAPVLIRLADGSLLVLGGRDATAQAWLYRPSLVGPASGSITALPDGSTDGVLTVPDPDGVLLDRSAGIALTASDADDYRARVLVGGPRIADGTVSAAVRALPGGVALIAQQDGPGHAIIGRLVPGELARIEQLANGSVKILCSGSLVDEAELHAAVNLTIKGLSATLTVGTTGATTAKASCSIPAPLRGAWGMAAAGAGARIQVGSVTVARTR